MTKPSVRLLIKLTIASLIIGALLAFLGLTPFSFWHGVIEAARILISFIVNAGWSAVTSIVTYTLFGALIVIPIWAVMKLLSDKDKPS